MALDLLVIAPHPDDAEFFCGGLIASMSTEGYRVGVIDLTRGELATRGSVAERAAETVEASRVLGIVERVNLGLPDGGLNPYDESQQIALVASLRDCQPRLVAIPPLKERHPDHEAAALLARRAIFLAGLQKYSPESSERISPPVVVTYQMRYQFTPSFVTDISAVMEQKAAAFRAYESQVGDQELKASGSAEAKRTGSESDLSQSAKTSELGAGSEQWTLLSSERSLASLMARDAYHGALIGVPFAEGYLLDNPVPVRNPVKLLGDSKLTQAMFFISKI